MLDSIENRFVYASGKLQRRIGGVISTSNLRIGEFYVLNRLAHTQENCPDDGKAARVSEFLDMAPPAITRILNSLEVQQLITRSIDISNRRSISIKVTEKGFQEISKAHETTRPLVDRIIEELGIEIVEKFIALIDVLANEDQISDE